MLKYLWGLITGEPNVAGLVANIERQRNDLATAAGKLRDLANKRKASAEALAKRAEAHAKDADWASRIADKFGDLIK